MFSSITFKSRNAYSIESYQSVHYSKRIQANSGNHQRFIFSVSDYNSDPVSNCNNDNATSDNISSNNNNSPNFPNNNYSPIHRNYAFTDYSIFFHWNFHWNYYSI